MKDPLSKTNYPEEIARDIAAQFSKLTSVEAVALGGSLATSKADESSDIDLYVYYSQAIPKETRADIIKTRSSQIEMNALFWETEDYWIEKESGIKVEVIYRDDWLLATLQDMFEHNRAHVGASTSLWHNVVTSKLLFDRNGWFASLKEVANVPYPDSLANAIVQKNFALLRGSLAAYPKQLENAEKRGDVVYIIDLLNMILNSYFDVLFALNRQLHPGSKRQLDYAEGLVCKPEGMVDDVKNLLQNYGKSKTDKVEKLIDELHKLLQEKAEI